MPNLPDLGCIYQVRNQDGALLSEHSSLDTIPDGDFLVYEYRLRRVWSHPPSPVPDGLAARRVCHHTAISDT